ncbi:hypothetical protein POSPLADRAFT_1164299 [Postia placenta MAD-698-R-SB12]|uniref:Large ribosomal subunit protein mL40 n=1 Tax=Postia placenta MAD-698-R-SB12 TaxID=670580 RepID=A0A1X6NEE9_9APHY|nr:hypothetical protein POSPLADRAFT_1164299 [Postia placenta MAD-698-R-SB12]OSX67019.1 hypothetical protein POSPLADRAFT_1164299 [Postia placenta MAD-698-R-SB12]
MLRSGYSRPLRILCRQVEAVAAFSSTAIPFSHQPNAPLDLDPSFRELLKDVEMSLLRQASRHATAPNPHARAHRELEIYPRDPAELDVHFGEDDLEATEDDVSSGKEGRKSPAAFFGSQRIGQVVLPLELQNTVSRLIAESDKNALHNDAKRLFTHESDKDAEWKASYDVQYKSWKQSSRHAERDGTAFASVALPSHYAAIVAVLDHVKRRLEPDWTIERVIDWGSGTGTGLWASSYSFPKQAYQDNYADADDAQLSRSTVSTYLGIDRREGLVNIGRRLVEDVELGDMNISWRKSFQDSDRIDPSQGGATLALSAFMLSSLSHDHARKNLLREIWESGAGVIVLIDHSSREGFENIAEAREYLLHLGRKELQVPAPGNGDIRGSHVVAPCPHDGACPLYHPGASKLVCGFSQRLQRPAFVRKTKHSGVGHEDTGYSYIVIRRGIRPTQVSTKVGRIGDVGKREQDKMFLRETPISELQPVEGGMSEGVSPSVEPAGAPIDTHEVEAALRLEAYSWPRLVFPPLKRSGHVILDGCTTEGKIMRMTIPKSQGKQPYYDARKSGWGDIFPHEPKNKPQVRSLPTTKREGSAPIKGDDIGKRRGASPQAASYHKLSKEIEEQKRRKRRRAWLLHRRHLRRTRQAELERKFQCMQTAMETLRQVDPKLYLEANKEEDPRARSKAQAELAKTLRVPERKALESRVRGLFPRELRIPTDTPSRDGWNYDWTPVVPRV